MDRVLETGSAFAFVGFLDKMTKDVGLLEPTIFDSFFVEIDSKRNEISTDVFITKADEKILNFLTKDKHLGFKHFMEIMGALSAVRDLVNELTENKDLSKLVRVSLYLYLFQSLYEINLLAIDRYLFELAETGKISVGGRFMDKNIDRNIGEHATAGTINETFRLLGIVDGQNDSILSKPFSKNRNAIGHFTAFYDYKRDMIMINKEFVTIEELMKAYERLYLFMVRWSDLAFTAMGITRDSFVSRYKDETIKSLTDMRYFIHRKIIRGGYAPKFGSILLYLISDSEE